MATNKTRVKIRHGSGKPDIGTNGLLSYELGWDGTNSNLFINNNGAIRLINSENAYGIPLVSGDNVDTLDPGIYISGSSTVSETLNGTKPNGDNSGFRLEVIKGYGTKYGALIAYDSTNGIKIRKNSGSNDFTGIPWQTIVTSPSSINLLIDKASPAIYLRNPDIDTTAATLSSTKYNTIYFSDVNSRYNAYVQAGQYANGSTFITIGSRRRNTNNDANVDNSLTLRSYADGTVAATVSHPAAWCSAIGAVNKAGDTMTGTLNRYYTATSTEPMIALRSYNVDVLLFLVGHATGVANAFSNHYKLAYKGTGSSPNNYLQLIANDTSADTIAMLVNESGNVSFTNTVSASISGNAATATKANGLVDGTSTMTSAYNKAGLAYSDYTWIAGWNGYELRAINKNQFALASHSHSYLPLTGGTLTGALTISTASLPAVIAQDTTNNNLLVKLLVGSGHLNHGVYSDGYAPTASTYTSSSKWIIYRGSDGEAHTQLKLYGAVWNDYAEYRNTLEDSKPGQCVIENGDDSLRLSTSRMQRAAHIVSDTFGFAIGKTDKCKTPVAVSGRVLAYIYEGRLAARGAIGRPVCSGPNGTVSIMTDEEYKNFGYCAIGTISAVPDYEKWGEKDEEVDINGRIWIKVY